MEPTPAMRWLLIVVVSCALLAPPVFARPPHRQKRVSDQRLAELETLLALAKMRNRKYVTLPVGFGLIDVQQIGRRKRAAGMEAEGGMEIPRDMLHEPEDYDIGDFISDFSSALSSDNLKEGQSLEASYPVEELSNLVAELKERRKQGLLPVGPRTSPRNLFLNMRGLPSHRGI